MTHQQRLFIGLAATAVMLTACGGRKSSTTAADAAPPSAVEANATQPVTTVTAAPPAATGAASAGPTRVIYFDYDSSEIRADFTAPLAEHARSMTRNASVRVRLEGHADERGSREYNIGLGERRAQAVRRALLLQGAADAQVSTVSYGEERPTSTLGDEQAWTLNRRVELVFQN
jgi:peptidoglycan-associated lipoprotein